MLYDLCGATVLGLLIAIELAFELLVWSMAAQKPKSDVLQQLDFLRQ